MVVKWRLINLGVIVIFSLMFLLFQDYNNFFLFMKTSPRNSYVKGIEIFINGTVCCNLRQPQKHPATPSWQIISNKSYIYSAYMDKRTNNERQIKTFIIMEHSKRNKTTFYCQVWSKNKKCPRSVKGKIITRYHWPREFYGVHELRCKLSSDDREVYAVSVSEQSCGKPNNFVHASNTDQHQNWNFTVCLSPIHGGFNDGDRFVEFVEIHRILGVQKIVVYNESPGPDVQRYLEMYKASKVVDIYPWKLPDHVHVHYFAQFAMLNDCLYRYMYKSKYIAFTDLDEIIVPAHSYTWNDLMSSLEQQLFKTSKCAFVFRNMFFPLHFPRDQKASQNQLITQNRVMSLSQVRRMSYVFEHRVRSKVIVNPIRVNVMDVHDIWEASGECEAYLVPLSVASLHHYRAFYGLKMTNFTGEKSFWRVDRTMQRYSSALLSRIIKAKSLKRSI